MDYSKFPDRKIICVDMKSFFASVSCVNLNLDPLTTHLAVVGSLKHKGSVVLASSPMMKKDFKIKTGSRLFEIPKDERIILVEPEMATYTQVSQEVLRVFARYAPKDHIYVYSIDEAFVDLSGSERLFGTVEEISAQIVDDIFREFGLTCCIGIGPNMFMSKVCLDTTAKHTSTGIDRWTYDDVPTKLWSISPLREVWGIGAKTEPKLNELGIHTMGDLAKYNPDILEKKFGILGHQLHQHAWGIDPSDFSGPRQRYTPKNISVGHGQTLMRDYYDPKDLKVLMLETCDSISSRLRGKSYVGRTVSLGLHYSRKFESKGFNRSFTLERGTNITSEIYAVCVDLFEKHHKEDAPVRKIEIRVSNVEKDPGVVQLSLFEEDKTKKYDIGFAVDSIRKRFGRNSVVRAVSLKEGATGRRRNTLIGGHKA